MTAKKLFFVILGLIIAIISLLLAGIYKVSSIAPVLELKPGKVQGFEYNTHGSTVEIFLNIPFALPPIGDLRFEKPRPVTSWENVRDGSKFGPACVQLVSMPDSSEDCLTLNIVRPKKRMKNLPILIWIHGGAFEAGSAKEFGFKGLANYAWRGIIVISIQYRLGVYGFFSTGDERIPGNLGLFDMAEALKFVNTNAENIGGDPSRITVWGHSAGSVASGQLILSPVTRDYIAQSIEMSGSPWGSWAIGASVTNNSKELAKVLRCETDIKGCLKRKTIYEIYNAVKFTVSALGHWDQTLKTHT